jgi:capsular polysaccharide biosynthesis protein
MELTRILSVARRKFTLIALGGLLGAVLLPLASRLLSGTSYVTTQTLVVAADPNNLGDPDRSIRAEVAIMRSEGLADAVAKKLKLNVRPGDLLSDVNVQQRPQSNIIDVTATATSASGSQRLANEYMNQYIEFRRAAERESRDSQVLALDAQLNDLEKRIKEIEAQARNAVDLSVEDATLASLQRQYEDLAGRKVNTQIQSLQREAGYAVIDRTATVQAPGLGLATAGVVGGVIGGVATLLGLLWLTALRPRNVINADDVLESFGQRPAIELSGSRFSRGTNRTNTVNLLAATVTRQAERPLLICVVSLVPSSTSGKLAELLTRNLSGTGTPVLLIDGNPGRVLSSEFDLSSSDGLLDLLTKGSGSLNALLVKVDGGIAVLPHGVSTMQESVAEIAASPNLVPTLSTALRSVSSTSVMDLGSINHNPIAAAFARLAGHIVLVIEPHQTRVDHLESFADQYGIDIKRITPVLASL